ncbi:sulfatase-like hydrolase/transferase [Rubripirellula reticaptiva]|uniref:Arylsulfatase n=1 Tax=Rubripirellula reticaptiva TaxID=2528013 RepID=A0A5C6F612_9BACT|nr:sulfatase-like hydrolase/transferase [Rubripirellula reticaptiva]TWU55867.1 Arylsulfatase [Rubripirellula reticaptiva]
MGTKAVKTAAYRYTLLLTFVVCTNLLGQNRTEAAEQPNVVFVFSDDQRYNSLSMTGDPVTQTPHLDRLATEGVFFNQAFITTPICGPSRANIFTGQWERKNHIGFTMVSQNVITEEAFANSWLMKLKDAGYSTAFIGKHHAKIVDRGNTPLKKNTDFCYYGEGHLGFHFGKHKAFTNLKNRSQVEGLFEATEAFLRPGHDFDYFYRNADKSVANCLKQRDPGKPFAAWVNFNLPHAASIGPMGSEPTDPEFYSSLYNDRADAVPFPDGYPLNVTLPKHVFSNDDLMPYYRHGNRKGLLNTKIKMNRAVYAIDQFIGNLRKMLADIDEDKNTIIVFCSDNGLLLGEHGFGGKTMLYEESVHVPLIVYSPFLPEKVRGTQRDEFVVGQDIPATILDMCGLDVPSTYQGVSMLPLIEGKHVDWRGDVFLENLFTMQGYPRQEAVRGERYKYIRYFSKENDRDQYLPDASIAGEKPIYEELFDLQTDPRELVNLASSPEYEVTLQTYRDRCQELVVELAE